MLGISYRANKHIKETRIGKNQSRKASNAQKADRAHSLLKSITNILMTKSSPFRKCAENYLHTR